MAVVSEQEITATSGAKESDTTGYQLIARYNLSKRTNVYGIYGQDKYDAVSTADLILSISFGETPSFTDSLIVAI